MFSNEEVAIDACKLGKCYEIYNTPRDRLKQFILPHLHQMANRAGISMGISKHRSAPIYYHEFWALQDVSFNLRRGETLGIIGRNGSGKSTLLQIIAGTLMQTNGQVCSNGRIAALLELGSGFNPEFTGRENVFLNGRILGLTKNEIESRYENIVEFSDIGDFIDQPIKTYSSGMTVRLSFAVAANVNPDIIIIDEALAVGDAAFQRKCIAFIEDFTHKGGILLFASHSMDQVRRLCNKAVYLNNGLGTIDTAKKMCDAYETDLFGTQIVDHQKSDCVAKTQVLQCENILEIDHSEPFEFPECVIHYGNRNANISRCWTCDIQGNRKAIFENGEKIVWNYQVVFDAACRNFFYGLMIKTKEGINLFGTNTLEMGEPLSNALAGDVVSVGFVLDSHLGPGEYFLNCSIAQGNTDDPVFIHRVVDAAIITIKEGGNGSNGLIDMDVIWKIQTGKNEPEK